MQDFRNLKVWQKAHALALLAYKVSADFPREELFGLRNSIRKTAVDVPAYIAEGCGKTNDDEFSKCLNVAMAFGNRLEYYVLIAHDLDLLADDPYERINDDIVEVKKMLSSFGRKLN